MTTFNFCHIGLKFVIQSLVFVSKLVSNSEVISLNIKHLERFMASGELREEFRQVILDTSVEEAFSSSEMLFKRGRQVNDWYFLLSGKVELIDRSFNTVTVETDSVRASIALNYDTQTPVSCIAKSDVVIARVSLRAIEGLIASIKKNEKDSICDVSGLSALTMSVEELDDDVSGDWMSLLLRAPLFSKVAGSLVQELFSCFEPVEYAAGDVVVKEGQQGDYFYVVSQGTATVFNNSKSVAVNLNPGSFFGEESLLGKTPRNATISMLTDGILQRLSREDFFRLLKEPILQYTNASNLKKMDRPYQIIDVKMPFEYKFSHIDGSINLPLVKLRSKLSEMDQDQLYVISQDAGGRADIAAHIMCQAGFDALILKEMAAPA